MKECKNCTHFEMCAYAMRDQAGNLIPCDDFRDKNKYVYAPFFVDDESYVITRYSSSYPYEVIKCKVTKANLKKQGHFLITCQGRYAKGGWYSGSFSSNSLGKTLFETFEEATKGCNKLNAKKN